MSTIDAYAFPLLDDVRLEDLFDAWVFAAREAQLALGAWGSSRPGERAEAHAVYRAALDREQCAAAVLASATSVRPSIAAAQP